MKNKRLNHTSKKHVKSKSTSKGFLHSTKFKILVAVIGVIMVASIGIGVGFGLTSSNSTLDDKYKYQKNERYQNLSNFQVNQLKSVLDKYDDGFTFIIAGFIVRLDSSKDFEALSNGTFDDLKDEVFIVVNKVVGENTKTFETLLKELSELT